MSAINNANDCIRTCLSGCDLEPYIEPRSHVLQVDALRQAYRPKDVRLLLIAESHVGDWINMCNRLGRDSSTTLTTTRVGGVTFSFQLSVAASEHHGKIDKDTCRSCKARVSGYWTCP